MRSRSFSCTNESESFLQFYISVHGLSGSSRTKGIEGVGKSAICSRLIYPDYYRERQISSFSKMDFYGDTLNSSHWIYWGHIEKKFGKHKFMFHIIERTIIIDEKTFTEFEDYSLSIYVRDILSNCVRGSKKIFSYNYSNNNHAMMFNLENEVIQLDAQITVYDVSEVSERDADFQDEFFRQTAYSLIKAKIPLLIAASKSDKASVTNRQRLDNLLLGKKSLKSLKVIETSAKLNINIGEMLEYLGYLILGKKLHPFCLKSQQFMVNSFLEALKKRNELEETMVAKLKSAVKSAVLKDFDETFEQFINSNNLIDFDKIIGRRKVRELFFETKKVTFEEIKDSVMVSYDVLFKKLVNQFLQEFSLSQFDNAKEELTLNPKFLFHFTENKSESEEVLIQNSFLSNNVNYPLPWFLIDEMSEWNRLFLIDECIKIWIRRLERKHLLDAVKLRLKQDPVNCFVNGYQAFENEFYKKKQWAAIRKSARKVYFDFSDEYLKLVKMTFNQRLFERMNNILGKNFINFFRHDKNMKDQIRLLNELIPLSGDPFDCLSVKRAKRVWITQFVQCLFDWYPVNEGGKRGSGSGGQRSQFDDRCYLLDADNSTDYCRKNIDRFICAHVNSANMAADGTDGISDSYNQEIKYSWIIILGDPILESSNTVTKNINKVLQEFQVKLDNIGINSKCLGYSQLIGQQQQSYNNWNLLLSCCRDDPAASILFITVYGCKRSLRLWRDLVCFLYENLDVIPRLKLADKVSLVLVATNRQHFFSCNSKFFLDSHSEMAKGYSSNEALQFAEKLYRKGLHVPVSLFSKRAKISQLLISTRPLPLILSEKKILDMWLVLFCTDPFPDHLVLGWLKRVFPQCKIIKYIIPETSSSTKDNKQYSRVPQLMNDVLITFELDGLVHIMNVILIPFHKALKLLVRLTTPTNDDDQLLESTFKLPNFIIGMCDSKNVASTTTIFAFMHTLQILHSEGCIKIINNSIDVNDQCDNDDVRDNCSCGSYDCVRGNCYKYLEPLSVNDLWLSSSLIFDFSSSRQYDNSNCDVNGFDLRKNCASDKSNDETKKSIVVIVLAIIAESTSTSSLSLLSSSSSSLSNSCENDTAINSTSITTYSCRRNNDREGVVCNNVATGNCSSNGVSAFVRNGNYCNCSSGNRGDGSGGDGGANLSIGNKKLDATSDGSDDVDDKKEIRSLLFSSNLIEQLQLTNRANIDGHVNKINNNNNNNNCNYASNSSTRKELVNCRKRITALANKEGVQCLFMDRSSYRTSQSHFELLYNSFRICTNGTYPSSHIDHNENKAFELEEMARIRQRWNNLTASESPTNEEAVQFDNNITSFGNNMSAVDQLSPSSIDDNILHIEICESESLGSMNELKFKEISKESEFVEKYLKIPDKSSIVYVHCSDPNHSDDFNCQMPYNWQEQQIQQAQQRPIKQQRSMSGPTRARGRPGKFRTSSISSCTTSNVTTSTIASPLPSPTSKMPFMLHNRSVKGWGRHYTSDFNHRSQSSSNPTSPSDVFTNSSTNGSGGGSVSTPFCFQIERTKSHSLYFPQSHRQRQYHQHGAQSLSSSTHDDLLVQTRLPPPLITKQLSCNSAICSNQNSPTVKNSSNNRFFVNIINRLFSSDKYSTKTAEDKRQIFKKSFRFNFKLNEKKSKNSYQSQTSTTSSSSLCSSGQWSNLSNSNSGGCNTYNYLRTPKHISSNNNAPLLLESTVQDGCDSTNSSQPQSTTVPLNLSSSSDRNQLSFSRNYRANSNTAAKLSSTPSF